MKQIWCPYCQKLLETVRYQLIQKEYGTCSIEWMEFNRDDVEEIDDKYWCPECDSELDAEKVNKIMRGTNE